MDIVKYNREVAAHQRSNVERNRVTLWRPGKTNVYFIQAGECVAIKIGVSKNVPKRMANLQNSCPLKLEVIGVIRSAAPSLERQIHARFRASRSYGEWFHPTPELLDFIRWNAMELRGPCKPPEAIS